MAYNIKTDVVHHDIPGPHLARYKIENAFIKSEYVSYDKTLSPTTSFNTVKHALDWLFDNRYQAGNGISITADNVIHADYIAGNGISIDYNPATGYHDIIRGDYRPGNAVSIVGDVISGNYKAGVGVDIFGNIIRLAYKEGSGIDITDNVISCVLTGSNGISVHENAISGDYKAGNAIRIDGDTIYGDYKAGMAIRIYDDIIHNDYRAGNGIMINEDYIIGAYRPGTGISIVNDIISAAYRTGPGVSIHGNIISGDYRPGFAAVIDGNEIRGDYKAGNAIDIDDGTINAEYVAGNAIEINNHIIYGDYYGDMGVTVAGDIISGSYVGTNGVKIENGVISGDYIGGNAISIHNGVISGTYHGGNAVVVSGDTIMGNYRAGLAIAIDYDVISLNYSATNGLRLYNCSPLDNFIIGDYVGVNGIQVGTDAACQDNAYDVIAANGKIGTAVGTVTTYFNSSVNSNTSAVLSTHDSIASTINSWYETAFKRPADSAGLVFYYDMATAVGNTINTADNAFHTNAEYFAELAKGNVTDIVTRLCSIPLSSYIANRALSSACQDSINNISTSYGVVGTYVHTHITYNDSYEERNTTSVIDTTDANSHEINSWYHSHLGRPADAGGLVYYYELAMQPGNDLAKAYAAFVNSSDFPGEVARGGISSIITVLCGRNFNDFININNTPQLDPDIISGVYTGQDGIEITNDVVNAVYTAGVAINIENEYIHCTYQGINGIKIANDVIYGDYRGTDGVRVTGNTIIGNYVGVSGIAVEGDLIRGNYTASDGVTINGNLISGDYTGGYGVNVNGNVISLDDFMLDGYSAGNAIQITSSNVVNGVYRGGTGIEVNGSVIVDALRPGPGMILSNNVLSVDPSLIGCCVQNAQTPAPVNPPLPPDCGSQSDAGTMDPGEQSCKTYNLSPWSGTVAISFQTVRVPDRMVISLDGSTIHDTGEVSGQHHWSFPYPGHGIIEICVHSGASGNEQTVWDYTLNCQ